jgi:hypothetical protein
VAFDQIPFYCRSKGTVGQSEEKWTLLIDLESGYKSVRHEWLHTTPYDRGVSSCSGERTVSVGEFLASDADATAKAKLRQLL